MSLNSAYSEKMQAQLKELGAKLDLYKAKAVSMGAEARVEIEKEIQKLQPIRENLHAKLEAAKTAGAEKWEEMKTTLEKTWADLKASAENIGHRAGDDAKAAAAHVKDDAKTAAAHIHDDAKAAADHVHDDVKAATKKEGA